MHRRFEYSPLFRLRNSPARYVAAVALFALALILRFVADGGLPPGFPYITFFPAIVIATFFLGTGPGILCSALSGLAAWYFFIPPFHSFQLTSQSAIALLFFILIVAVDIFIIDRMFKFGHDLAQAQQQSLALAQQRDAMYSELQHRVGNNLTMVSSMLNMQGRYVQDPTAKMALSQAARRMGLIGDINRMFHDPAAGTSEINTASIRQLGEKVLIANAAEQRITLQADVQPVTLAHQEYLLVMLIVMECISNAIEHGYGNTGSGTIGITGHNQGSRYALSVTNAGKTLPAAFSLEKSNSIGLRLVKAFATQLGGEFAMDGGAETTARLSFPV